MNSKILTQETDRQVITQLVVVVLSDLGPQPVLDIRSRSNEPPGLDEEGLMRLGIAGMTAIGQGTSIAAAGNQLHGSFPVPERGDSLASLVYPFNVRAEKTEDNRLETFGREVLLFILFAVEKRNVIFASYSTLESLITSSLRNIKTESEITEPVFTRLLSDLNDQLSRPVTSTENALHIKERVDEINSEIAFLQDVIDLKLRDQQNPILVEAGSELCEDFSGNEEDAEKLYDLIEELLKVDIKAARDHVKLESLYRIGNYHYQVARWSEDRSEADLHLERALKFFKLACSVRDDPFVRLSIGSVLFKRSRDLLARENVNLGLKLLRKTGLDESVLNETEIYRKDI